jgi:uncharacterized protein YjbI with pentapeptide repeats
LKVSLEFDVDLSEVDLSDVDLSDVDLSDVDLSYVDLWKLTDLDELSVCL